MIYLESEHIKIYKVKPWAVYFRYKDDKFLLHVCNGTYTTTSLYYKEVDMYGNYKLSLIHSDWGDKIPNCVFETTTYSHINKREFIYYLTLYGFIDSEFSEYITDMLFKVHKLNSQISDMQNELNELNVRLNEYPLRKGVEL